jgi:hypothetical protein
MQSSWENYGVTPSDGAGCNPRGDDARLECCPRAIGPADANVFDYGLPYGGVTQEVVHRMVAGPNNVLVINHFDDVETARAFFGRGDLKEAIQRGGVQGEPRV